VSKAKNVSKNEYLKNLDEGYSNHIFGWREAILLGITYLFSLFFIALLSVSEVIKNETFLNIISYIFTFSLCILVFHRITLKFTEKKMKLNFRTTNFQVYVIVFPLMLGGMLISEYFVDLVPTTGEFFGKWWNSVNYVLEKMLDNPIYMILLTCIFAPILEEILFRGILQKGLINKGISPIKAIFLSSFVFGIIHANPWQFVSAFILGLVLGWVYQKTETLLLPMLLHGFNNISACVLTLNKKQSFADFLGINAEYLLIIGILFVLIFGYLFYYVQSIKYLHQSRKSQ